MKSPNVVMVGSSMVDLVTRVPRLPLAAETLVGSDFKIGFGGKGSNQAVMAARLGAAVTVVVKLGQDVFGEQTLANYRQQNIETAHVGFVEGVSSGVAPITVDEATGQNIVLIVPGANAHLSAADVAAAQKVIGTADVLVCQLEVPLETTLAAFKSARRRGVTTLLNPAPAADLPAELLTLTDLLVPNEVEAAQLTGLRVTNVQEAEVAARELQAKGPKQVVVTLGKLGALVLAEQTTFVEAQAVKAVDTTGAGDAFVGSLAYFLGAGFELVTACERACAVATLSVQKEGTQSSFAQLAEVKPHLDALGLGL